VGSEGEEERIGESAKDCLGSAEDGDILYEKRIKLQDCMAELEWDEGLT